MRFSILRFLFLLCLPAFSPLLLFCQQKQVFALQNDISLRIAVDSTITDNALLEPFTSNKTISGLAFSGEITLQSDSSLVRIILMDDNFNEYLVYEIYPILAGSNQLLVEESGEETSLLNNITPYQVKIELVDASVHLKEFFISQEETNQANSKGAVLLQQTKNKIERINRHIHDQEQPWVAGETSISKLSYQEKKSMFGGRVPNFQGFEYYVGGVFVLPGALGKDREAREPKAEKPSKQESQFVSEFSWRNRHGEDWITPAKDQTGCSACYVFGPVAAAELLVNLYFNRHLNYDLSEQNIVSCTSGSCRGGSVVKALDLMQDTGIVLEECFPYTASEEDCSMICDEPSEQIRIAHWEKIKGEDAKKRGIIKGATTAIIRNWDHAAQVVGYKLLELGDGHWVKYLDDDPQEVFINSNSPLIGETAWLIKNSWGESWGVNGFGYVVGCERDLVFYGVNGSVSSMIYSSNDILCNDADGDGSYYWGIGPKPSHCPESPEEADGDDSDPCISSMDEFGNLISFTPAPEAEDTIVLFGQTIPDLFVSGNHIRWYSDSKLQNLLHTENLFPAGQTDPGDYVYYVTQTISSCESAANQIWLSIVDEIPPPIGHDTIIDEGEAAVLKAEGEKGAEIKWYEDPQLTVFLDSGDTYQTGKTAIGIYTYYATQTRCLIESAPDTVFLEIMRPLTIPDQHLLDALIDEGVDTNRDNRISYSEAEAIASLNVNGSGIRDMTGIEAFFNLETLDCGNNKLATLDVSACLALIHLGCSENQLSTLIISNNAALKSLDCSANRLTSLDVSYYPALIELDCSFNELTTLDIYKNTVLASLDCSGNRLYSLDVSKQTELLDLVCCLNVLTALNISNNTVLRYLNCAANDISDLDISKNHHLEYVNCGSAFSMGSKKPGNPLISLRVSNSISLKYLICQSCNLTNLNVSNCLALTYLNCNNNQLSRLDVSETPALDSLFCYGNQLESLNVSNNTALVTLECGGNLLTGLDLSNNTALEKLDCRNSQISTLNVSENKKLDALLCTANQLARLDVSSCTELETLKCDDNQLTSLNISNNPSLLILNCNDNQLTSLDVTNNISMFVLECCGNLLSSLNVSNNTELRDLRIDNMPTLHEVCVWTTPFPPSGFWAFHPYRSPNINFTTECGGTKAIEQAIENGLLIYPNPTLRTLILELEIPDHYLIRVTSLNGQLIFRETMDGCTHQIDLSSIPGGVYLIRIESKDFVITKKIVKL